jgi:uncharacterized protein (TIGR00251 family)
MKETNDGLILGVKVIPKAHRNEIVGWENDELKVRIKAVPVKGEANQELLAFLAKVLHIAPSRITLLTKTGRHKRIRIAGISLKDLLEKIRVLQAMLENSRKP